MRRLQGSKYFYDVDLVETSQSELGATGSNSGMVFKKFIVKTRLDYLGAGGKAQATDGQEPSVGPKTGT
jgi:hypothetical protein